MAYVNEWMGFTMKAGGDLTGSQYKAIALADGLVADTGVEASGIIMNKPKSGEAVTVGAMGVMKYIAGDTIAAAGAELRATTSGYFITASSGYYKNGRSLEAVTSGSIGSGVFNFTTPPYQGV